ncbi:type II toxin-antitoxin system VapC family toxin [Sorangium sp. So ce131]|uniref:type II toxin-antitoxin system VapC family toxin n=1 Tax=Sorangium sp. So ce131 TaxID=3133282 RepID=UPI003F612B54
MILRKVLLDTNIYIGWLNGGMHADLMVGPGLVRYLSGIVLMELRAGATTLPARRAVEHLGRAYRSVGRVMVPDAELFDQAGRALRRLREAGREVRRSSLVNDVLIALSARSIGATVITADEDYGAIRSIVDFKLERIAL